MKNSTYCFEFSQKQIAVIYCSLLLSHVDIPYFTNISSAHSTLKFYIRRRLVPALFPNICKLNILPRPALIITICIYVAQLVAAKYCFLMQSGKVFAIDNRYLCLLLFQAMSTLFSCLF